MAAVEISQKRDVDMAQGEECEKERKDIQCKRQNEKDDDVCLYAKGA